MNVSAVGEKCKRVKEIFSEVGRVVIAFSGGVDSSVLLKLAIDSLGADNVLAVTAVGAIYPSEEKPLAEKIAKVIGAKHMICKSPAIESSEFMANTAQRCYHCKKAVMGYLKQLAAERGFNAVSAGENADDDSDYRPGHRAIAELGILCPLRDAGLTKKEIRQLARDFGLPNWNTPPGPCLVTRLPYGQAVDIELLKRIDNAEIFIRSLGFDIVRVRVHNEVERTEKQSKKIDPIVKREKKKKIVEKLKCLGFQYISVDLQGYRTGSMNEIKNLKIKNKQ